MSEQKRKRKTPDQKFFELKKILIESLKVIHDSIVDVSDESKTYYRKMFREFTILENKIRRI